MVLIANKSKALTQFHKESLNVFDQPTFEVPFPHFGVESKELKIIGVLEELVR